MISVNVKLATKDDLRSLAEMPPYSEASIDFPSKEDILIAEGDGKVLGAVSIGRKDISFSSNKPIDSCKLFDNNELHKVSGPWISKLFVFPAYRYQGIGTKLVEEAIEYLKEKGFAEVYAAIYIKNPFRVVSREIFEIKGFTKIGSCVCKLSEGYCQGTLLKKVITSSEVVDLGVRTKLDHKSEDLADEIKSSALLMGAELVGFTSAERLEAGAPEGHKPSDLMPNAKSAIILACGRKLNEDRDYFYKWGPNFSLTYIKLKDEVKQRRAEARRCIEVVKNLLVERGFNVVTEPHGWSGILSFKMAAYSAGMGVFGRGSFLVHPQLGPLNVLACMLTDAPLGYGSPLKVDICKDCMECIKACKYGAYKQTDESFKWLPEKCRSYDLIMNPVTLKWTYGPCNSKCVMACPIGKTF
jgi:epoxyqueuosine reductase QueG/GNAT superfamily N-acetyltransferase